MRDAGRVADAPVAYVAVPVAVTLDACHLSPVLNRAITVCPSPILVRGLRRGLVAMRRCRVLVCLSCLSASRRVASHCAVARLVASVAGHVDACRRRDAR
jgi:hypothetical protein